MTSLVKGLVGGFALLALSVAGQAVHADVIDDIKKAGVLKVGVKADYKPYGFLDPSGAIVGIEALLKAAVG